MKHRIALYASLILISLSTMAGNNGSDSKLFDGFLNPAQEYWPGVRFAVQGKFDATNEIHLAGLESEIRELYNTGISTIEIQASNTQPNNVSYMNQLKVFYSVGNELGMSMDLRVGGAGGIQGGIPQALSSSNPLSVKGGYVLKNGDSLQGVTNLRNSTFDEELKAVLAIRYTVDPEGNKVQQEVKQLNITDFRYIAATEDNPAVPSAGGMQGFSRSIEMDNGQDIEQEMPQRFMPEAAEGEGRGFPGGGRDGAPEGRGMPEGMEMPEGGGPSGGFSNQRTGSSTHDVTVTYNGNDLTIGNPGETWDILAYYKAIDSDNVGMDNTDFYSQASARVITANTDAMFDDDLKALIKDNGKIGGRFAVDGGDRCQRLTVDTWSDELVAKVKELHGYDFTDYIPVQYSGYKLPDENAVDRLNNDWREAYSYLFVDYLTYLEKWANDNYNSSFRGQYGYSTMMDTQVVCQAVAQPDVESFWPAGGGSIEDYNLSAGYLAMTSVSNVLRKHITAGNELGARSQPHGASWVDFLLVNANKSIYSGVNKMIYHCIDSQYGNPWGTAYDLNGYMSWGDVNPTFITAPEFNNYIKRAQYILQNGAAERDIMVYDHVYKDSYQMSYHMDESLIEAGYNYDIVSPGLLETENLQTVSDGVVDPEGGRYKALVIKHLVDGVDGNYMPLVTAETILMYAKKGIPVIIVGEDNYPKRTMSISNMGEDKQLTEIFDQINALGKLTVVDNEPEIASALDKAGIQPNLRKKSPSRIVSYKRVADNGKTSCYFLYNYAVEEKTGTISETVALKGTGVPYLMEMWSGEITPIAKYSTTVDGYTQVDVTLEPNETCLIAITDESNNSVHSTDIGSGMNFDYDNDELVLKAFESGEYSVALSDGSSKTVKAKKAAEPLVLNNWTLQVESWTPTYGFGKYPDDPTYSKGEITTKTKLEPVQLSSLKPWSEIESIDQGVSGVGYYTASFEINGKFDGAMLDLGEVFETAKVIVNGVEVPINMTTMFVDLEDCLVKGANTLEVVVPSDIQNVLLANGGQYTGKDKMQDSYGLIGPVVIKPYVKSLVK